MTTVKVDLFNTMIRQHGMKQYLKATGPSLHVIIDQPLVCCQYKYSVVCAKIVDMNRPGLEVFSSKRLLVLADGDNLSCGRHKIGSAIALCREIGIYSRSNFPVAASYSPVGEKPLSAKLVHNNIF